MALTQHHLYVLFHLISVFLACELFTRVICILEHGKYIERFVLLYILLQLLVLETSLVIRAVFFVNAQGVSC